MRNLIKANMRKVKKIILYSGLILCLVFLLCLYVFPEKTVNFSLSKLSKFEFIFLAKISPWFQQNEKSMEAQINLGSHRGLIEESSVENSPQSIDAALNAGFTCLEVDVSFSSDFIPYIFHGPDLKLIGLDGMFSEFSAEQISKFRLENNQPVISLKTFCKLYGDKFNTIYLDVKGDSSNYKKKAKNLTHAIENYELDRFVLIGAPWMIIRSAKKELREIKVGYEQKGAIANYLLGGDTVSLYYKYEFSHAEYKLAKFLGLDVVIWTINDRKILEQYSKKYKLNVLTDLNI